MKLIMKKDINKYLLFFRFILLGVFLTLLTSCFLQKPANIIISEKKILLTTTPLIIKCPTPFTRTRKSGAVQFEFLDNWNIYWSPSEEGRGGIKLGDGRIVFISVTLIDSNGKSYSSDKGRLSGGFAINFSMLPQNVKIIKMKVSSSIDVKCKKIYWHCYDPI